VDLCGFVWMCVHRCYNVRTLLNSDLPCVVFGLDVTIFRSVHHGVDSGKKFLKFDFTLEFEPDTPAPSSSTVPDHGRRRVCLMAILPCVSESIDVFREVYLALDLPTVEYFFQYHCDFKAIAIAIGTSEYIGMYGCVCARVCVCVRVCTCV